MKATATRQKKFGTKHSLLHEPSPDTIYLLEDNFLSNLGKDGQLSPGETQVEFFLFMVRVRVSGERKHRREERFIHFLTAETEGAAAIQMLEIAERDDVQLVEEQTHEPVAKNWQQMRMEQIQLPSPVA